MTNLNDLFTVCVQPEQMRDISVPPVQTLPPQLAIYQSSNKTQRIETKPIVKSTLRRIQFDQTPIFENRLTVDGTSKELEIQRESRQLLLSESQRLDQSQRELDLNTEKVANISQGQHSQIHIVAYELTNEGNDTKILDSFNQLSLSIDKLDQLLEGCKNATHEKRLSISWINSR